MHLQTQIGQGKTILKSSTIHHRFSAVNCVIKKAIKDKIITENPLLFIQLPKMNKPKIVYLTFEELKLLVQTDCKIPELKRAFLFSCLTGLRWSDVYKLKWEEIEQESDGSYLLVFRQLKTSEPVYLNLPDQALIYLGERQSAIKNIFDLHNYSNTTTKYLQDWCVDAGVNKKITFHSSRHTFAA